MQSVYISRDNGASFEQTDVATVSNGYIQQLKVGPVSGVAYALMEFKGLFKTTSTIVVPDAPTNLREAGRGKNGVSFRFDDDSDIEDGFVIQRQDMGIFVSIDTTGGNSGTGERRYFRDRNLTPGTVYNYRVAAYNSAGASAFVPISITTLAETTPSIPDNRSWTGMTQNIDGLATPGSNTEIAIKHLGNGRYSISDVSGGVLSGITGDTEVPGFFYESSGQTYFEIDFDFELLEEENGTWDDVDEITLFWRLDKDGNGGPYPDKYEQITLSLNLLDPVPAAPSDVLTYVYSNTSIEVSWTGTAFEEDFLIDRSTAPGGPFTNVGSIPYPATSYIDADPSLVFGQTYYYQIRGSNTSGSSTPSSTSAGVIFNAPNFVLTNSEVTNNSQGLGTGFIWGDYDNDGDEDLILVQLTFFVLNETTPYGFQNNGDGTFTSVNAGFEVSGYLSGAVSDYNNDGNLDIFITSSTTENLLYQGNGDFTFTKVDPNPVGENILDFENASLTASWVDYDNNGLLDLFVSNQDSEELLFSQTSLDVFTKITTGEIVTFNSRTNTNAWADYDNDGDMDVFVLNNSDGPPSPNRLYKNNGDGTFTHVTGLAFDADLDAGAFGASWGDYDNDGDMDLFLAVQEGAANLLYRNNGAGGSYNFTKVTGSPVTSPITTPFFGSAWGDIDNDGDLDLLLSGVLGENIIYKGDGAGNFGAITNEKFNDSRLANFGVSLGDYDNDGFLDLAAGTLDPQIFGNEEFSGPGVNSLLFKNNQTSSASKNWLKVKLVGTTSNKSAIGARLTLTAGGKTQIREITTSSGFGGQNSLIAHFGLGSAASITSLQIKWPSGIVQSLSNVTVNQTLAITEDNTGPVPLSFSPANGGTGIVTTATLQINLNEMATVVGGKLLKVYDAIDLVTPIHSIDVATATQTGNSFTFTIPSKLNVSTEYAVDVEAGAFKDVYNNDSPVITTSQWGFTTGTGPVPSVFLPAHNSTNVSTATKLEITFGQTTTAVSGKNLNIFESTNLTTPVFTFDVATATLSGNTYTFTLPSKFNLNTTYVSSVEAGAFIDADANDSPEILKSQWGFSTSTGPAFLLRSPANGSTGIALSTNLEITFTALTTPVSGKSILLFKAGDLTTAIETINVTDGVQTGNKHAFALTSTLEGFTTYTIGIGSGAFIDANQNDFAGLAPGNWTFTTIDNIPPQVVFTPPGTANKGFGTATYSTGATDNGGTVASVVLSHRKISGGVFTDVAGTFNSVTNMWDFTIAEPAFGESGLEYFITATDATNNEGRLPESPTEYFYTYLLFGGDNIAKIPSARLGFGGALSNWKIFSIPFDLGANNSIVGVFDELSSKEYKTEWRFITYQNTTNWLEYPTLSTIDRGKGYFINIKDAVEIALTDNLQAPTNNRSNLFQMTLKQGWNQVGNPYLSIINWSDVSTFNSLTGTAAALKTYASSSYVNATSLQPYEGGFVFVDADITISIPFAGQVAPGGRVNNISSELSEEDWIVPLVLQQQGVTNELSGIGMNRMSSISMDDYDDVNPPRFINFLEMNFDHPEHFAKRFSRDVVPTREEYTWTFTVDSNLKGLATLNWDNTGFGTNENELYLLDIAQQKSINMREASAYTFDANSSSQFKVYFGENLAAKIQPEKIQLGKAYPNPTSGRTTIPFTLPKTTGSYHVRLEVYDMVGRRVDILQNGILPAGFYETEWDSTNKQFSNGLYTYRLVVAGDRKNEVYTDKIILNK
ncbi:MAG: FG-GAP-like repeat-containing protein [Cyclobacteriaceae bacterium]